MNRLLCIVSLMGLLTAPAVAQEATLPAGVLIYDAVPAAPVPSLPDSTVVLPAQSVPAVSEPVIVLTPAPTQTNSLQTQSLASTRSPAVQPVVTGTVLDPATVTPQVNLAPGETVVRAIAVSPAIVQIPNPEPVYTSRYEPAPTQRVAPPPKRDPVTGRLRDTPGWTGRREAPASIGCYPAGACAVLNAR